jgi:hypothetical protein
VEEAEDWVVKRKGEEFTVTMDPWSTCQVREKAGRTGKDMEERLHEIQAREGGEATVGCV